MLFRLFTEIIPLSTVNVALGKPAVQSSTDHGGLASRAVDGDINSNWGGSSCTHTAHESEPWFRVDLQLSVFVVKFYYVGCLQKGGVSEGVGPYGIYGPKQRKTKKN